MENIFVLLISTTVENERFNLNERFLLPVSFRSLCVARQRANPSAGQMENLPQQPTASFRRQCKHKARFTIIIMTTPIAAAEMLRCFRLEDVIRDVSRVVSNVAQRERQRGFTTDRG